MKMDKQLWLLLSFLILLTAATVQASVIDAPHNETNGIQCSTCHTYSLWWQYSPADQSPAPHDHGAIVSAICSRCHDGSHPAYPPMLSHSSTNTGSTTGTWNTSCTDCHDPHFQAQLDWASTYAAKLYLITGTIDSVTDNGNGTSSLSYSGAPADNLTGDWTSRARWSKKDDSPNSNRGLVLVVNTVTAENTYLVVSATATTITVKGVVASTAAAKSFGLIYGQLIKSMITVPNPPANTPNPRPVKFFNPDTTYAVGGFTNQETPPTGICQVCHTKTTHWTQDGLLNNHNASIRCTACHDTAKGFKPGGHTDKTFAWAGDCNDCHTDGGQGIVAGVHKNTCTLCHNNPSGGTGTTIVGAGGDGNAQLGAALSNFRTATCLTCHPSTTYPKPWIHHNTQPAVNGACTTCHNTTTGHAGDHTTLVAGTAFCITCHTATAGGVDNVPVSTTDPKVHNACTTCHVINTTTNIVGLVTVPTPNGYVIAMPAGGGDCTTCHGAFFPKHRNPASLHNMFNSDPNCASCHDIDTTAKRISLHPDCITCHKSTKSAVVNTIASGRAGTAVNCETCHDGTTNGAPFHGLTPATAAAVHTQFLADSTCASCHDIGTAAKRISLHPACTTCHTSTLTSVINTITTGKAGTDINCQNCHDGTNNGAPIHGLTPATAAAVHGNFSATPLCATCHNVNTAEQRISLHPACITCHTSTDQTVIDTISSGINGTQVQCINCHTANPATFHHASAKAVAGKCSTCHIDPRPSWKNTIPPGDNGGSSPFPTQMACKICHVRFSGSTIYIDKLSYATANDYSNPPTRTVQHTLTGITAASIDNFGICFSCHNGTTAKSVAPLHAMPSYGASRNRYYNMQGAPGRGTFNLLWDKMHGGIRSFFGSPAMRRHMYDFKDPTVSFTLLSANCGSYNNCSGASTRQVPVLPALSSGQ